MFKKKNNGKKVCHNIQFPKFYEDMLNTLCEKLQMKKAQVVRTALHEFHNKHIGKSNDGLIEAFKKFEDLLTDRIREVDDLKTK